MPYHGHQEDRSSPVAVRQPANDGRRQKLEEGEQRAKHSSEKDRPKFRVVCPRAVEQLLDNGELVEAATKKRRLDTFIHPVSADESEEDDRLSLHSESGLREQRRQQLGK